MSSALRIGFVAAIAVTLAGCSTMQQLGLLRDTSGKGDSAEGAPAPDERERIPVIALDQQLKTTDALKGKTITIPAAAARTDWPLPGGTPEQSIEHVEAGSEFRVAW